MRRGVYVLMKYIVDGSEATSIGTHAWLLSLGAVLDLLPSARV